MRKNTLTTEQIIDGLELGTNAGGNYISEPKLKRAINNIRTQKTELQQDSVAATRIRNLIEEAFELFSSAVLDEFNRCEFYVLPHSICVSHSRLLDDRKIIVISEGMLDLLFSMASWSQIGEGLPNSLEDDFPFGDFPKISALSGFSTFTFLLICRGYVHNENYPSFASMQSDKNQKFVRVAFMASVMFLIVHEVGHLALGHLTNDEVRPVISHQILQEHYSIHQKKELEADGYVYQSLKDDAKDNFTSMLITGLNFYSLLENLISASGDLHPLTLNRVHHGLKYLEDGILDKHFSEFKDHVSNQADRYMRNKKNNEIILARDEAIWFNRVSREEIVDILKELEQSLSTHGLDISSLINSSEQHWHEFIFSKQIG